MKIAIFATNVAGIYSGGRYLSLIMGYALARAGAEVTYYTNLVPTFDGDFEEMQAQTPLAIVTEEHWPDQGDHAVDWVIVIPTGGLADGFYAYAKWFAKQSTSYLALLSFETINWFNSLAAERKSALPWESWVRVVSDGGLVLAIAKEGMRYAQDFYSAHLPDVPLAYDYWYPAINDVAARSINWQSLPVYPDRIVAFVRTSDAHKGASELLQFPPNFYRNKTICLIFGRGVDQEFVDALQGHVSAVPGSTILAFDRVTDQEKLALLASSSALLFPSRFEGFGYPPVEAAYVGTPSAAYDLPVVRETMGESARFAEVGDVLGLAQAVHELACAEVPPGEALAIPARCETEVAGRDLIERLRSAESNLSPLTVDNDGLFRPVRQNWPEVTRCWGHLSARLLASGDVLVQGYVSTRSAHEAVRVRIEQIDVDKLCQCRRPSAGTAQFNCLIPASDCLDQGMVRVDAVVNRKVIQRWALPVQLPPEQILSWPRHQNKAPLVGPHAVFHVASDRFGVSLAEQFALKDLVFELAELGFEPVLLATRAVTDRLGSLPEFAGVFAVVAEADEVFRSSSPMPWLSLKSVSGNGRQLMAFSLDQINGHSIQCVIDNNTILYGSSRSSDVIQVREFLDSQMAIQRICFVNFSDENGLRPVVFEFKGAVLNIIDEDATNIFCFMARNDEERGAWEAASRLGLDPLITEKELLGTHWTDDLIIVDCAQDPAAEEREVPTSSANVRICDYPDLKPAAEDLCRRVGALKTREVRAGPLRRFLGTQKGTAISNLGDGASRVADLLRRNAQMKFFGVLPITDDPESGPPVIKEGALYLPVGSETCIGDLIVGSHFRVLDEFVEIRSDPLPVFEFINNQPIDWMLVDFVIMICAEGKVKSKTIEVGISVNGQHVANMSVRPNEFVRFSNTFSDLCINTAGSVTRIELFTKIEDKSVIFRLRSMSFLTGSVTSAAEPDDEDLQPEEISFSDQVSEQSVVTRIDRSFEIRLNSSASIVACGRGWGAREAAYRWTVGYLAEFYVPFRRGCRSQVTLEIVAGAFLPEDEEAADMAVHVNGLKVGCLTFGRTPATKQLVLPQTICASGFDRLDLVVHRPRSPASIGLSGDARELGFCVYALRMMEEIAEYSDSSGAEDSVSPLLNDLNT